MTCDEEGGVREQVRDAGVIDQAVHLAVRPLPHRGLGGAEGPVLDLGLGEGAMTKRCRQTLGFDKAGYETGFQDK